MQIYGLFALLAIRMNKSEQETHITPLSKIKTATVVIDANEEGAQESIREIHKFFKAHHIESTVYALSFGQQINLSDCILIRKRDLCIFGWIRNKNKKMDRFSNLYLSLVNPCQWLDYYEAVCSHAIFKAARYQTNKKHFDLVLGATDGKPLIDVFHAMTDLMLKIV